MQSSYEEIGLDEIYCGSVPAFIDDLATEEIYISSGTAPYAQW